MTDDADNRIYEIHGKVCAIETAVHRIEKDLQERPCIEHGRAIENLKVRSGLISAIGGTIFGGTVSWLMNHLK